MSSCIFFAVLTEGEWWCSVDCQKLGQVYAKKAMPNASEDRVLQYSSALTWRGLYHMVERDAERENDGLVMIAHWRIAMLDYWRNNHYKYLNLGHRILAGKEARL